MMTWKEICGAPSLHDLPYMIEPNRYGQSLLNPALVLSRKRTPRIFQSGRANFALGTLPGVPHPNRR